MKIKTIKKDNYNLHIIKTNNTKKINLQINFKNLLNKSEITIRNLLRMNLIQSTKKYPSERLLNIASENLYDITYGATGIISSNISILSFDVSFVDPSFLKEDIFEKDLAFLFDIIFNPNVSENKFDKMNFELTCERLKANIALDNEEVEHYAQNKFLEYMDSNAYFSYNPNGYLHDLKNIDEKKLYDAYIKMINEDSVDAFIIGNVDEKIVEKIFDKYFILKSKRKYIDIEFPKYELFRKEINEVTEYRDINQSKLFIGFKTEPLTLFEKQYVSYIYSNILGGSSDSKLFMNVREKNSLCYYIYSTIRSTSDIMIISSGIDCANYDKTVELIKNEVLNMKNGKFDNEDINKAISAYLNGYESILDSQKQILSNIISHVYLGFDLVEDRIKNIKKVTKEDIINLAKKIHIDTIYLLHGGDRFEKDI